MEYSEFTLGSFTFFAARRTSGVVVNIDFNQTSVVPSKLGKLSQLGMEYGLICSTDKENDCTTHIQSI